MLDFENRKVKELHEFMVNSQKKPSNLLSLKSRLQYLYKFYYKETKGVLPFVFGKDYKPDMPDEELEYVNKAVLVTMEERKRRSEMI